MKVLLSGAAAGLLLGLCTLPALADTVPDLDIEKTCRSAKLADPTVNDKAAYEGCLRSERDAKRQAEQHWSKFTTPAKRQCESQFKAGGYPSYVEMITCLELASGTAPSGDPDKSAAVGGDGSYRAVKTESAGPQNLTKEPSPSQRTNPIKVLEKD